MVPRLDSAELSGLLVEVSAGDQEAFGRFYDATSHTVFGMVLSVIGDRREAETVAEDVYVTAWRLATTFDPSRRSATAWLDAIVGAKVMHLTASLPVGPLERAGARLPPSRPTVPANVISRHCRG